MSKQQSKTKKILIVADLGASNPKFIVSLQKNKNKLDYLILDSRMQQVPSSLLDKYREEEEWLGEKRLACEDAFLQLANEDKYWVFGSLSEYFDPEERLDKKLKKYESGALRILCGLGILIQQRGIQLRHLELDLCVLLPANEFGDQERFLNYFGNIAQDWSFRGEPFSCTLNRTKIEREGAGTLRYLLGKKQYKHEYENKNIGLVMAGYRNISLFLLRSGKAEVKESPIQGFHQCVERVCKNNAAIQPSELNSAMGKAYYSLLRYELELLPQEIHEHFEKINGGIYNSQNELERQLEQTDNLNQKGKLFQYNFLRFESNRISDDKNHNIYTFMRKGVMPRLEECQDIKNLIKVENPYLAKEELNDLVKNIKKELKAYGEQFQNFLERYLKNIDKLIVMGGTSIFLYHWISIFCNSWDQVSTEAKEKKERVGRTYIYSKFPPPYESSSFYSINEKDRIEIDSLPHLKEALVKDFGLDDEDRIYSSIPLRFLDCYCFYQLCMNQISKEQKEERKQKKEQQLSNQGEEN